MKEKRRARRIKDKLILSYEMHKKGRVEREAASEDISFTGLRIRVPKDYVDELSVNQMVGLQIYALRGTSRFFIGGKIVWIERDSKKDDDNRVGIMFVEVDDFQKNILANYLHGAR